MFLRPMDESVIAHLRRLRWGVALALLVQAALLCAAPVRTPHVEAELVVENAAAVPGESTTVALRLKIDDGWHTYWRNPGDTGLPTTLDACLTGAVLLAPGAATLQTESCRPPNGHSDPGETVTYTFCIQNSGGAATGNLVATLQNSGGVSGASSPQDRSGWPDRRSPRAPGGFRCERPRRATRSS